VNRKRIILLAVALLALGGWWVQHTRQRTLEHEVWSALDNTNTACVYGQLHPTVGIDVGFWLDVGWPRANQEIQAAIAHYDAALAARSAEDRIPLYAMPVYDVAQHLDIMHDAAVEGDGSMFFAAALSLQTRL